VEHNLREAPDLPDNFPLQPWIEGQGSVYKNFSGTIDYRLQIHRERITIKLEHNNAQYQPWDVLNPGLVPDLNPLNHKLVPRHDIDHRKLVKNLTVNRKLVPKLDLVNHNLVSDRDLVNNKLVPGRDLVNSHIDQRLVAADRGYGNSNLAPGGSLLNPIVNRDLRVNLRNAALDQDIGLRNQMAQSDHGVVNPATVVAHRVRGSRISAPLSGEIDSNATSLDSSRYRRHMFKRKSYEVNPSWKRDLYFNHSYLPSKFKSWMKEEERLCDGKMVAYAHEFASFQVTSC